MGRAHARLVKSLPWEETDQYIRSGHRSPEDFEEDSLRTITLSEEEGIKAVVGKLKGEDKTTVQSYLFDKAKGWTLDKAKAWFEKHREGLVKEHVSAILPFQVLEKIVDKPLRIRGIAMTAGMSRNFNIYTPEELQAFASKLVNSPVYIEHVSVDNAVGKVTKTDWDGHALWYEAEIYDGDVADKIRKGLVRHVSVGADYETLDIVDGKIPHGLHNAELSLVAVPGIPETNVMVLERLSPAGAAVSPSMQSGSDGVLEKEELERVVVSAVEKANGELKAARDRITALENELASAKELQDKLAESEKRIAELQRQLPAGGLLKDPPRTMPIAEAIGILEGLLLSPVVERSSLGEQRHHQQIRSAIWRLKERLQSG